MAFRRVHSILKARSLSMDKCLAGSILARQYSSPFVDSLSGLKHNAKQILSTALQAVAPDKLVRNAIQRSSCGKHLYINDITYPLNRNIYVAAFGKGVYPMVKTLTSLVHDHIVDGIVSVPANSLAPDLPNVRIIQGGSNNLPDSNSMQAAQAIMDMAKSLGNDDILLVLITGGGSALLPLPSSGQIVLNDTIHCQMSIA